MLVQRLFPQDDIVAVRYFTALVRDRAKWEARQRAYHDALLARSPEVVDIALGRFEPRMVRCRGCGTGLRAYEEKETDLNIGLAIADDSFRAASDSAVLISGDGDLCAAIRYSRTIAPARRLEVAFPPNRSSQGLRYLADRSFIINESHIRKSQLPPVLLDAKGRPIRRPESWK